MVKETNSAQTANENPKNLAESKKKALKKASKPSEIIKEDDITPVLQAIKAETPDQGETLPVSLADGEQISQQMHDVAEWYKDQSKFDRVIELMHEMPHEYVLCIAGIKIDLSSPESLMEMLTSMLANAISRGGVDYTQEQIASVSPALSRALVLLGVSFAQQPLDGVNMRPLLKAADEIEKETYVDPFGPIFEPLEGFKQRTTQQFSLRFADLKSSGKKTTYFNTLLTEEMEKEIDTLCLSTKLTKDELTRRALLWLAKEIN